MNYILLREKATFKSLAFDVSNRENLLQILLVSEHQCCPMVFQNHSTLQTFIFKKCTSPVLCTWDHIRALFGTNPNNATLRQLSSFRQNVLQTNLSVTEFSSGIMEIVANFYMFMSIVICFRAPIFPSTDCETFVAK